MSEPKRIDIKSGRLSVNGETWHINITLSTIRYVEYLKRSPKLCFGNNFHQLYDTLSKIYMAASSGNDMIFAIQTAKELSWNQLEAIRRFDENEIPDVIDFCALFINAPGENSADFNSGDHEHKKELLHKEGFAVQDFFFLAYNVIESFHEAYQLIQKVGTPNDQKDLTLQGNTQQTNSIS